MEANAQPQLQPNIRTTVTVKEFDSHFSSKREAWRFLSNECLFYLPEEQHVSIFHLKDLAYGRRRPINCQEMRHIHVPQYEGLTITTLIEFAQ